MYILVKDGAVVEQDYSVARLRRDNPQVSFPEVVSDAVLAEFGVFTGVRTNPPAIDGNAYRLDSTFALIDGVWTQVWEPVRVPVEQAMANIRDDRNARLAACDWTQLPDAPVDAAAWATYRQALRDITAQPDPYNIVWPDMPI